MRLKSLRVQGYKSFADRTELLVDSGIVAIVGPNGSGKSNLADAVLWVLGEQSYHLLRGKRTEDMIFSGSEQRARLGMAEVQITLDNDDGLLPLAYREITIARRAYRSGENEYLLNTTRVRLKEILELLGHSGMGRRTYTVIGQGLVDQALSLRPEERRLLVEEAAGITVYQDKRNEALTRLADTQANRLRILDILAEIEPRLHALERQARRTEQVLQAQSVLRERLRVWYGYRWQQGSKEVQSALAQEDELRVAVASLRAALVAVGARRRDLADRQEAMKTHLADATRESSQVRRQIETAQREIAVRVERQAHLQSRFHELQDEVGVLQARLGRAEGDRQERSLTLERLDRQIEQASLSLKEAEASLTETQAENSRIAQEVKAAQNRATQVASAANDAENRLRQLSERREETVSKGETQRRALDTARAQVEEQAKDLSLLENALARQREEQSAVEPQHREATDDLRRTEDELQAVLAEASEVGHEMRRLNDRLDLLTRLREEGAGYAGGTRAVLAASRQASPQSKRSRQDGALSGILGTVGTLLQVPARFEVAIESALGSHLQDIVVEKWCDAERAIAYLKESGRGQATFLPLDTLRPPSAISIPSGDGIYGLAADVVAVSEPYKPVVHLLLNRVLVVDDLPTARRVIQQARRGAGVLVTLSGEQVRPGGSVSGGSRQQSKGGGLLSRERESRELAERLKALEARAQEVERSVASSQDVLRRSRQRVAELEAERSRLDDAVRHREDEQAAAERRKERALQMAEWQGELLAQSQDDIERTDRQIAEAEQRLARLKQAAREAQADAERLAKATRESGSERWLARVTELKTTLRTLQSRKDAQIALLKVQEEERAHLQKDVAEREERSRVLALQQTTEQDWLAREEIRLEGLTALSSRLQSAMEPQEKEIAALQAEEKRLVEEERAEQARLQEQLAAFNQAQLARQRAESQRLHLQHEIERDFGVADVEGDDSASPSQSPLPFAELVETLPSAVHVPAGLEDEIRQHRAQLGRLGAVNPSAPTDFMEEKARIEHLQNQVADLERAEGNLRRVVQELGDVMETAFQRTFQQVAERFRENFKMLFRGGSARLEMRESENGAHGGGVEILARIPGKRSQSLALLSGGERALTAIALIFSILEVSPTPFCLLDEVDAMLDEANVERFRDLLYRLSRQTQFLVITHNRVTIEAADAVYGVSMGTDSTSRIVSLRLGERATAAKVVSEPPGPG